MNPTQNKPNDSILVETPAMKNEDVTPRDMMWFAKLILLALAVLFILGGVCEILVPCSDVFEACKTILPPIATLVIGYYFGKS